MFVIEVSKQFKKDLKRVCKQRKDSEIAIKAVIQILADQRQLPKKYKNHKLSGNWNGYSECHIKADLILIYSIDSKKGLLKLTRIGSHALLFKM